MRCNRSKVGLELEEKKSAYCENIWKGLRCIKKASLYDRRDAFELYIARQTIKRSG